MKAVSYTHLDVYKRQAQGTGADGGKHPSAVTGAVHEEAAGRSAAAAEA